MMPIEEQLVAAQTRAERAETLLKLYKDAFDDVCGPIA